MFERIENGVYFFSWESGLQSEQESVQFRVQSLNCSLFDFLTWGHWKTGSVNVQMLARLLCTTGAFSPNLTFVFLHVDLS